MNHQGNYSVALVPMLLLTVVIVLHSTSGAFAQRIPRSCTMTETRFEVHGGLGRAHPDTTGFRYITRSTTTYDSLGRVRAVTTTDSTGIGRMQLYYRSSWRLDSMVTIHGDTVAERICYRWHGDEREVREEHYDRTARLVLVVDERFDDAGRVLESRTIRPPAEFVRRAEFTYDRRGRMITRLVIEPRLGTMHNAQVWDTLRERRTFDSFGRTATVEQTRTVDGGTTFEASRFAYDAVGRLSEIRTNHGISSELIRYAYDELGRCMRVDSSVTRHVTGSPSIFRSTTHTYDADGRVIRQERRGPVGSDISHQDCLIIERQWQYY